MGIFSNPNNQNNEGAKLSYTNEEGTRELQAWVNQNIASNGQDVDRIARYHLYWNFYNGNHWRLYNDTLLSFNYVKAFINKVNSFLLGKEGFQFEIINEMGDTVDEEVERKAEAVIDFIWRQSKKVVTQYEIFQMGGICGDVWLHPQYVEDHVFSGKKKLVIDCLDSRHCFPQFKNGDINQLESFILRLPLIKNTKQYAIFVKRYTKDKIETWYQKNTDTNLDTIIKFDGTSDNNPYGFIPVVHIKNKPKADDYFGISDCSDTLKINKIFNEHGQTIKEIIDYYAVPTTVVTGGTVRQLTKGLGRIWSGLPAEANVFNLGLGEDLSGSMMFWDKLKMTMHELSDVPENTLGKLQAISNTSAAALQITYQPLIQQADIKSITYSDGFVTLHRMLIMMLRKFDSKLLEGLPENFEETHTVRPVYTYGLPQDRMIDLQQSQLELSMKVNSRKAIMNRLGVKNVPLVIKEIKAEDLEFAKLEGEKNQLMGIPGDNGNPDFSGQQ